MRPSQQVPCINWHWLGNMLGAEPNWGLHSQPYNCLWSIPHHICNTLARPCLPNAIMLAIGGSSGGDPTNAIEAYDIHTDDWTTRHTTRSPQWERLLFWWLWHGGAVRKFDLSTHTWHEVAPMSSCRCSVPREVMVGTRDSALQSAAGSRPASGGVLRRCQSIGAPPAAQRSTTWGRERAAGRELRVTEW